MTHVLLKYFDEHDDADREKESDNFKFLVLDRTQTLANHGQKLDHEAEEIWRQQKCRIHRPQRLESPIYDRFVVADVEVCVGARVLPRWRHVVGHQFWKFRMRRFQ